jgi:serine/threonine protein phosphatase PrpC
MSLGETEMLTSTVAMLYDNSIHGDDRYFSRELGDHVLLDAVMDGVTGRRGADASQAVVDALERAAPTSPDDVVAVLEEVNDDLYFEGWGRFLMTTVSIALVVDKQLFVIGAGDSPVILMRPDTVDVLAGHASGFVRAGLTKVVGARERLSGLYRAEVTLAPGDRLVLATDGITDCVTRNELVEITRGAATPADAAAQVEAILATRYKDERLPDELGGRFRRDDRTAIFRFFSAAG